MMSGAVNFARRISLTLSHQFSCVSQSVIFDPQYVEFREKFKTVDVIFYENIANNEHLKQKSTNLLLYSYRKH